MNDHLDGSGAEDGPEMPNRTSKGKFVHYLRRLQPARTKSEWGHLILGMGLGMYGTTGVTYGIIVDAVPDYVGRYFLIIWVAMLFWLVGVILTRKKRPTGKRHALPEIEDSGREKSS